MWTVECSSHNHFKLDYGMCVCITICRYSSCLCIYMLENIILDVTTLEEMQAVYSVLLESTRLGARCDPLLKSLIICVIRRVCTINLSQTFCNLTFIIFIACTKSLSPSWLIGGDVTSKLHQRVPGVWNQWGPREAFAGSAATHKRWCCQREGTNSLYKNCICYLLQNIFL